MAYYADLVNKTSQLDRFIGKIWQKNPTWLNCYIGTEEAPVICFYFWNSGGVIGRGLGVCVCEVWYVVHVCGV